MKGKILAVKNLSVRLKDDPERFILRDVSLALPENFILGIVGGSGSGKTTLGMALLRLLPPAMEVASGQVLWEGKDIFKMSSEDVRRMRGQRVSMIFQEPMSAFNPVYTIGQQIVETMRAHRVDAGSRSTARVLELLSLVEVPDPVRVAASYPHELSGGLAQRAMIAQALSCGPSVLIADEPTSSLDVTTQARVMETFRHLQKKLGLSMVLISHDLGLVRHLADEVLIMSEGCVIERGSAKDILIKAKQPYTRELIEAE